MKIYKKIIILWVIIVLFSVQVHGALFAFISAPFVLIYLVVCLFNLLFKRKPQKEIGIKLVIIAVSYVVITAVHVVRFKEARSQADFLLMKIQAFHAIHGQYPANSLEVGLADKAMKRQRLFYINTQGSPTLFYPATQMPFDTYSFNFKKSKWKYRSS